MLADGLIEPQVRHLHGQGQGSTGFGFVDPLVTTTLYRCRNYDVVTGANRFDASDVTGGNVTSGTGGGATLDGHAHKNPPRLCYESLSDDPACAAGTVKTFK